MSWPCTLTVFWFDTGTWDNTWGNARPVDRWQETVFTADFFAILAFLHISRGVYMTVLQIYFINLLLIIGTPTAALKCLFAWFCLI